MKNLSQVIKQLEELRENAEILPSGLLSVDAFIDGGFFKKEFVVIGAGTGQGKSLFGGTIFKNVAMSGYSSAYFSLEISNEMIVSRLIGAEANISPAKVMIKQLSEEEEAKKEEAEADLSVYEEFMTFYDDLYLLNDIEKEIREKKFDFVVIDFIQNVGTQHKDEYERLTYIALRLQQLAKELNCCILALSQLSNRMSRDKSDKETVEYKGSGAIGIACDLGFYIERTDMDNVMLLRLRKNRRGISGETFNFYLQTPGGLILDIIDGHTKI